MDFFDNYLEYFNYFDLGVIIFGMLLLISQIIIRFSISLSKRNIGKLLRKNKLADGGTTEKSETAEAELIKNENFKILWIKSAGIIREMISILPFAGILGTVIGLLNTLKEFGNVEFEIGKIMYEFTPALTSTISAIVSTIVNMVMFSLILLPQIIENDEDINHRHKHGK